MEPVETIVRTELLGTVVSTIVLSEVAAIVVISGTEGPVLTVMREVASVGILRAVEYAHSRDVVLAELACVVELCLIEEVAHGGTVVDRTASRSPEDAFLEVEIGIALLWLQVNGLPRIRIDPFLLCVVIEIVDASSVLLEDIIPTDQCAGRETLGDEVELLCQREVGVDTCGGVLLCSGKGEVKNRVRRSLRVSRIIAPGTVAVAWDEGIARCAISGLPKLTLTKRTGSGAPRTLALAVATEEVDLQCGGARQGKIEVGTGVNTIKAIACLVAAVVVPLAEKVTLVQVVDGSEVLHELRTTTDIDVRVVGHGVVLKHLFLPVYIGIALGLLKIGGMAVFLNDVDGQHLVPRVRLQAELLLSGLVADHQRVGTVKRSGQLADELQCGVHAYLYLGLTLLTTLGGDEDNAVGTTHTVDSSSGSILEHGNALH